MAPSRVDALLEFTEAELQNIASPGRLKLLVKRSPDDTIPDKIERYWRLIVRPETIQPSGSYGVDGSTDRLVGGTVGAEFAPRANDFVFELVQDKRTGTPFPGPENPDEFSKQTDEPILCDTHPAVA